MRRPPKHVANDAANWIQHVEVDAVQQQPGQPIRLVVIDGFVGSIFSVLTVISCTVESTELRPIVGKPGQGQGQGG
jgi:hypothetical protein